MEYSTNKIKHIEAKASIWMHKHGLLLLRISIGIVFFWFGILKFFPGLSPAQDLAIRTISLLTLNLISGKTIIIGLASWEVLIGIGFLTGKYMKPILVLLFVQMAGTFAPAFFFPNEVFNAIPYAPTLEGQYIIKNIVIISAALVIGGKTFVRNPVVITKNN
ncbi:MAG: hypothetical protein PHD06_05680 [Bacteroidales bacterium]|nr:hypothetical protein [Bacteroidales bacterium]MDD4384653.1 hypothetical protein [Bacteroidales bacterium]MDY0197103.1 hypothetical protein [Tenuifilaceae bacterium]